MPQRRGAQRRLLLMDRIKDGRIYQKSGTSRRGIIYLRCQKQTICQGTAKIVNGVIRDLQPHSQYCLPDNSAELIARFKQALAEALSQHWYRLKALYDSLAAVHSEAAEHKSFQSLRSFMRKCRRRRYPPCPENITEFVNRLADPANERNLEYDTGRLSVQLITDPNGAHHALFFDENFVREEMGDVTKLLIDATFQSRPRVEGAYQLMTVMGIKFNHGFPFVWIVMTRKTQAAYTAVLQYIKQNIMPSNDVILAMSDFERGLRNAISEVFTTAHSTGCNTHYDRAIYRKAKSLGLQALIRTNADAKRFFKKMLALAYLPAELVDEQYRRLWENLSEPMKGRFSQLNAYYRRYWLQTVTPNGFSVYGLGRRTNNIIESYHSRLGHRMENRPGPWDFVCKLLKLQSDVRADIRRLRNNGQISRHARYATVFKQKQLVKAWRELHMLEITVEEFLEKAASLKGNVDPLIAQQRIEGPEGIVDDELDEPVVVAPLDDDPDYERELFAEERPHWLLDNAEVAAGAVENDSSDDETDDDTSDSSQDDPVVEVLDPIDDIYLPQNAAEWHSPPRENIEDAAPPDNAAVVMEEGRQTPQLDNIVGPDGYTSDSTSAESVVEIVDQIALPHDEVVVVEEGRQTPQPDNIDGSNGYASDSRSEESVVEIPNRIALPHHEVVVAEEVRQTPPPGNIEDVPHNEALYDEGGRQSPPPTNQGCPTRKRKRRKRRRNQQVEAPAVPACEKNQKRNKRRKEMKKKALVRQRDSIEQPEETVRLRAELEEAQNELQAVQNRLQIAEDNVLCKICYLARATHTFWPCGHCCCCASCADRLWNVERDERCPMCRTASTEAPRRIWLGD